MTQLDKFESKGRTLLLLDRPPTAPTSGARAITTRRASLPILKAAQSRLIDLRHGAAWDDTDIRSMTRRLPDYWPWRPSLLSCYEICTSSPTSTAKT